MSWRQHDLWTELTEGSAWDFLKLIIWLPKMTCQVLQPFQRPNHVEKSLYNFKYITQIQYQKKVYLMCQTYPLVSQIQCFIPSWFHFPMVYLSDHFIWTVPSFNFIHVVLFIQCHCTHPIPPSACSSVLSKYHHRAVSSKNQRKYPLKKTFVHVAQRKNVQMQKLLSIKTCGADVLHKVCVCFL